MTRITQILLLSPPRSAMVVHQPQPAKPMTQPSIVCAAPPASPAGDSLLREARLVQLLSLSARRGNAGLVEKLLSMGANPLAFGDESHRTPLMLVAEHAAPFQIISRLIPLSNIFAVSACGSTALALMLHRLGSPSPVSASQAPHAELLDCLSALAPTASIPSANGRTPLMILATSWSQDDELFSQVLGIISPLSDFNAQDTAGLTACFLAAIHAHQHYALLIFQAHPEPRRACSTTSPDGQVLAHAASASNSTKLLEHLAPFSNLDARDSFGRTPLLVAASKRAYAAGSFLLAHGADPRAVDHDGCDALMLAIEAGGGLIASINSEQVAFFKLLASSANLHSIDFLGESALDKARYMPRFSFARRLILEAMGLSEDDSSPASPPTATLPATTLKLQNLLASSIQMGCPFLVKRRLGQGADPKCPVDSRGSTALMIAADKGDLSMIEILAPLGDLLARDNAGKTAIARLFESANPFTAHFSEIIDSLSGSPVIHASNGLGTLNAIFASNHFYPSASLRMDVFAPLLDWRQAIDFPHPSLAMMLWDALPQPEAFWAASICDIHGSTLAHLAARSGNHSLLQALLPFSNLAATDRQGLTPLMAACSDGLPSLAAIELLAPISDCRAVDVHGRDALMLAIESSIPRFSTHLLLSAAIHLVDRCDLFAADHLGATALHKAHDFQALPVADLISSRLAIFAERSSLALAAPAPWDHGAARALNRI